MLCEKCVHSDVCVIKCMHRKEERKEMIACKNFMRKADVAPRAELDRVARELERVENLYFAKDTQLENAKAEVAREIFAEIERSIFEIETPYQVLQCLPHGYIAELKKKYAEGQK